MHFSFGNSYLLGQGFFADRVVSILNKQGRIKEEDTSILKRASDYLDKTKKGEEVVRTGQLSSSAGESVDDYRRAVIVLSKIFRETEEVKIEMLIENLKSSLDEIIKKEVLITSETSELLKFFSGIREIAVKEGSKHLGEERAILEWSHI